tara:strand:- start:1279 stop:2622 length:1344 start_codon:yes stop_codon:yes gene_type:complete
MLGLMSTETFAANRFKNYRRSVLYHYPAGAAPLMGILSMLEEETTDDPEFNWFEKRLAKQVSATVSQGSSKGPFYNAAGSDAGATFTWTADTVYRINITATQADLFRIGHQIKVTAPDSATNGDLIGVITARDASATPDTITVRAINTVATVTNGTTNQNVGKEILVVGSVYAQGAGKQTEEVYSAPTDHDNYAQIFRTPFSLTGTAARTQAKYDKTGPYKDKAKEHSLFHSIEMEKAMLFGHKHKFVDAAGLPVYSTGGILYHMQQWELTAANPYGETGATLDSDDNKRIITNASGTINSNTYDDYLERVFRVTSNKSNEKLVLCGSGFLSTLNKMYKGLSVLDATFPSADAFGMSVVKHMSPFGTVYYKTHPLFSQNPILRNNALFLDVHNIKYRYMEGRDTQLLKNRQDNGDDFRRDEYLTEAGLELNYPESCMYLQNVTDWEP